MSVLVSLMAALSGAAGLAAAQPAQVGPPPGCSPRDGLAFICGPVGSTDLVQAPGQPLLILSGLHLGGPGHLYLVDTRQRRAAVLFPTGAPDELGPGSPDCPPLNRDEASYSGMAIRKEQDGTDRVYVINNGRHAVEIFRFDPALRRIRWQGCTILSPHAEPRAVATLPDGGLLVSSFNDALDLHRLARMARAEPTGSVLAWHEGQGFTHVKGLDAVPGANGLEVSSDGRTAYVSAWSAGRLLMVRLFDGAVVRTIAVPFLPDKIHELADGELLVTGQATTVARINSCARECPQPWAVVAVDPANGRMKALASGPGSSIVNYAASALAAEGALYIAVRGADRLAYVFLKADAPQAP